MNLPLQMIRMCRKRLRQQKVADSSGMRLSGASLLMRTLILRRLLLRHVLQEDEKYIGILLPPSAGGVITNAAVTLCGRVSANLNYTVTQEVMNACIERAGIRHVLTSRRVLDKLDFEFNAEVVLLEDFREKVSLSDKLSCLAEAYAMPLGMLEKKLGVYDIQPDDELTVIFTSGSTGIPKGVVLTHGNIGSNVQAIQNVLQFTPEDTFLGILPFFHSFGFTVTLWTVLGLDVGGAYHYSPLEPKAIGKLMRESAATVMGGTPTFFRSYLKRCSAEDFNSLNLAVAGAEKLPLSLSDAFERKFGHRIVEGYGTTELSPLVAVNIPPSRAGGDTSRLKEGTVGQPIPGVEARTVDPDTRSVLPQGVEGLLQIKGPNVMKGYLHQPEETQKVLVDGWYDTGDMALIDEDGFISITGRLSRFSKIGGEMVPHLRVEEELLSILDVVEEDGVSVAVTAVKDERKGEKLIVLHRGLQVVPEDVRKQLSERGLPALWIPDVDAFLSVDEIPILGTGKLDLKALAELAVLRVGAAPTS